MGERDPDFFKLHYRQWRRRMHKARVPYDLQGALLAIVIETHQMAGPPADDDFVLAGIFMTSPRKARAVLDRLKAAGLIRVEDGLVIDKTAIEDARERAELRAARAEAGREGGRRSGIVRRDKARLAPSSSEDEPRLEGGSDDFASAKPLKSIETGEAKSAPTFEPEKSRGEIHGGGARARASPPVNGSDPILGDVIELAGIDLNRDRNPQRWFGSESRDTLAQWRGLGLTDEEIRETVAETIAAKPGGPPGSLAYFNPAMQRRAGRKARPPLQPDHGSGHDQRSGKTAREHHAERELADDLEWARNLDRTNRGRS